MSEMKRFVVLAAVLALAACETMPASVVSEPTGSPTIPSTPIDLGDWRNASEAATLRAFQQNVTARYGVGVGISAAAADLRLRRYGNRRGD